MSVPEGSDGKMTGPNISGNQNQTVGSVADSGKAVGTVGRDVIFNDTTNQVVQAREPVTWQFQLKAVPGFVGRKAELAEIEAALKGDGCGDGTLANCGDIWHGGGGEVGAGDLQRAAGGGGRDVSGCAAV